MAAALPEVIENTVGWIVYIQKDAILFEIEFDDGSTEFGIFKPQNLIVNEKRIVGNISDLKTLKKYIKDGDEVRCTIIKKSNLDTYMIPNELESAIGENNKFIECKPVYISYDVFKSNESEVGNIHGNNENENNRTRLTEIGTNLEKNADANSFKNVKKIKEDKISENKDKSNYNKVKEINVVEKSYEKNKYGGSSKNIKKINEKKKDFEKNEAKNLVLKKKESTEVQNEQKLSNKCKYTLITGNCLKPTGPESKSDEETFKKPYPPEIQSLDKSKKGVDISFQDINKSPSEILTNKEAIQLENDVTFGKGVVCELLRPKMRKKKVSHGRMTIIEGIYSGKKINFRCFDLYLFGYCLRDANLSSFLKCGDIFNLELIKKENQVSIHRAWFGSVPNVIVPDNDQAFIDWRKDHSFSSAKQFHDEKDSRWFFGKEFFPQLKKPSKCRIVRLISYKDVWYGFLAFVVEGDYANKLILCLSKDMYLYGVSVGNADMSKLLKEDDVILCEVYEMSNFEKKKYNYKYFSSHNKQIWLKHIAYLAYIGDRPVNLNTELEESLKLNCWLSKRMTTFTQYKNMRCSNVVKDLKLHVILKQFKPMKLFKNAKEKIEISTNDNDLKLISAVPSISSMESSKNAKEKFEISTNDKDLKFISAVPTISSSALGNSSINTPVFPNLQVIPNLGKTVHASTLTTKAMMLSSSNLQNVGTILETEADIETAIYLAKIFTNALIEKMHSLLHCKLFNRLKLTMPELKGQNSKLDAASQYLLNNETKISKEKSENTKCTEDVLLTDEQKNVKLSIADTMKSTKSNPKNQQIKRNYKKMLESFKVEKTPVETPKKVSKVNSEYGSVNKTSARNNQESNDVEKRKKNSNGAVSSAKVFHERPSRNKSKIDSSKNMPEEEINTLEKKSSSLRSRHLVERKRSRSRSSIESSGDRYRSFSSTNSRTSRSKVEKSSNYNSRRVRKSPGSENYNNDKKYKVGVTLHDKNIERENANKYGSRVNLGNERCKKNTFQESRRVENQRRFVENPFLPSHSDFYPKKRVTTRWDVDLNSEEPKFQDDDVIPYQSEQLDNRSSEDEYEQNLPDRNFSKLPDQDLRFHTAHEKIKMLMQGNMIDNFNLEPELVQQNLNIFNDVEHGSQLEQQERNPFNNVNSGPGFAQYGRSEFNDFDIDPRLMKENEDISTQKEYIYEQNVRDMNPMFDLMDNHELSRGANPDDDPNNFTFTDRCFY